MASEIMTLKEMEQQHILLVLEVFNFNRSQASRALGITYKTICRRIKDYKEIGIVIPDNPNGNPHFKKV